MTRVPDTSEVWQGLKRLDSDGNNLEINVPLCLVLLTCLVYVKISLQISLYYCLLPMKIGPRLLNWALTQGSSLGDTMLVNP